MTKPLKAHSPSKPGFYKIRDGRRASVILLDAPGDKPIIGFVPDQEGNAAPFTWRRDGFFGDPAYMSAMDIIGEWVEVEKQVVVVVHEALVRRSTFGVGRQIEWATVYYRDEDRAEAERIPGFVMWTNAEPTSVSVPASALNQAP